MAGRWFATDNEDAIDDAQQTLLDVLRGRANSDHWPTIDPADTKVALPGYVSYGYPLGRVRHRSARCWPG
jgi:hypothetical protein